MTERSDLASRHAPAPGQATADRAAQGSARGSLRLTRAGAGVLLKVSIMAAAVAAALGLLEVGVRLFDPQLLYRYPKGLFVNDAVTDYRLAPGFSGRLDTPEYSTAVRINRLGLRDSRELGQKPAGTRRLLVLGDSFVMGHSVDEREDFTSLVEAGLNRLAGRPLFTVLNSGVPGFSTREELAYLRSRGFALEPDAVVLVFFVGNDIADNAESDRHYKVLDGYLTNGSASPGSLPIGIQSFLALHSHLYHLLWPIQHRLRGLPMPKADDRLAIFRADGEEQLWKPTEDLLAEVAATVGARGLPFVLVLIPDMIQIDPQLWHLATADHDGMDAASPSRRLVEMAATGGVAVLDLYPVFRSSARGGRLYYPIDHHLTRAGNRVAADALTPFLWEHLSTLR